MGNALISGILFQPPRPATPITYFGPSESSDGGGDGMEFGGAGPPPPSSGLAPPPSVQVSYLWLLSPAGADVPTAEWTVRSSTRPPGPPDEGEAYTPASFDEALRGGYTLIPAMHIRQTDRSAARYTMLYSHGNAEDLGMIGSFLTDLARLLCIDVVCYDYSGYGMSRDALRVSLFWERHGAEVRRWHSWRAHAEPSSWPAGWSASRGVFAAPMVHPTDGQVERLREEVDAASGGGAAETVRIGGQQRVVRTLTRHAWSPPAPSEEGCYMGIAMVYNYLSQVEGVHPRHVLLYGKSVGSGPTCWLTQRLCADAGGGRAGCDEEAIENGCYRGCGVDGEMIGWNADESRDPSEQEGRERAMGGGGGAAGVGDGSTIPGGVVLHSPFLSVIRVVLNVGFTTYSDMFPNIDRVGDFKCPVYVIHGTEDEIVPFSHGEGLFEALPEESRMVPFWAKGAQHNNIEMGMPNAYIKRLYQFIRQCDRLNYPNQKKSGASRLGQGFAQIKAKSASSTSPQPSARPALNRYASQDNYHSAPAPSPTTTTRPSKQRKQKGTLVMRSTHNAGAASSPAPRRTAPPAVSQCASSPNLSRKRLLAPPSAGPRPSQVQLHPTQEHPRHEQYCGDRSRSGDDVLSISASSHRQFRGGGKVLSSSISSRRRMQSQGGQFGGFRAGSETFARENALVLQRYRE